jgi:predicted NBD/HSP70 family sugar kinase
MTHRVRSANRDLMRRTNEALVLGLIHDLGPISRSDIAMHSGLSQASISNIAGMLIGQGIVFEERRGESTGGRRPTLLSINHALAVVVGVKVMIDQVVVALVDLGAELIDQRAAALKSDRSPAAVVALLGNLVDELRLAHAERHFLGIGVGMAGIVDHASGTCRYSPFLQWHDIPMRQLIETRLALPVILENDVNTLALAERWFGIGAGTNDFLVVTLGIGVGMGLILNGALYRGGRDGAGEFGHTTVVSNGRPCTCGKRGCLEAYIGEPGLQQTVRERIGTGTAFHEAVERARSGDARSQAIFDEAGQMLGLGLAAVINAINPTLIVVGGEGAHVLDLLLPALRTTLERECFADLFTSAELVMEPWGDDAWARGAASLLLDDFFHPENFREDAGLTLGGKGGRPLRLPWRIAQGHATGTG